MWPRNPPNSQGFLNFLHSVPPCSRWWCFKGPTHTAGKIHSSTCSLRELWPIAGEPVLVRRWLCGAFSCAPPLPAPTPHVPFGLLPPGAEGWELTPHSTEQTPRAQGLRCRVTSLLSPLAGQYLQRRMTWVEREEITDGQHKWTF